MFIDLDDFVVVRKVNRSKKDITFKKQNDRYYLKKIKESHGLYGAPIPNTDCRITLYNYLDIEESNLDFIQLPNWVKKQMK